mmetsp:Transcript_39664/g.99711  ORF Transcript_39664/g.99711 Transcript_39664/m.99711 type:complete len:332 (-) Transcript_39664:140-1135(-)
MAAQFSLLRRRHFLPLEGNRSCTLDIFRVETELTTGAAARVRYYEDVEVPASWRKPITLRLPQHDPVYIDQFIQRFSDSKISSGYKCCHQKSFDEPRKCTVMEETHFDTCSSNDALLGSNEAKPATQAPQEASAPAGPAGTSEPTAPPPCSEQNRFAKKDLPIESIARYFHLPIHQAAEALNVGETWLKQKMREHDIKRWPYRKVKSLDKLVEKVQQQMQEDAGNKTQMTELNQQLQTLLAERHRICMGQPRGAYKNDPGEPERSAQPQKRASEDTLQHPGKKMCINGANSPRYCSPRRSKLLGQQSSMSPLSNPFRVITNHAFQDAMMCE